MTKITRLWQSGSLLILLLIVLALLGCARGQVGQLKVLRIGLIPADDAAEMLRQYKPVADYLAGKLKMKVEVQVTDDYTAAIEAMRNKHIEMAWFGPFSYVLAAKEAGAEAVVVGTRRDTGKSTYRTVFVTKAGSGIKKLEDLKGRSVAFVDPASTSGYLIPRKILADQGIDPARDFSTFYYAGTHNAVELAVKNGTVDAGADSDTSYNRMVNAGEIDPKVNVIIHTSEPIPGSPIVVRGDLPQDLKDKIQQALIDMDQQTIYQVKGWGDIEKYEKVTDSAYDIIRDTARVLNLELK
ncbi:MAG: phosphonate ABC transporter substrate-binding protein [Chloroflexi bacterium]|nr:phosphonate ABC transporter substrate-binding protein [Chloroflexota bacterium]